MEIRFFFSLSVSTKPSRSSEPSKHYIILLIQLTNAVTATGSRGNQENMSGNNKQFSLHHVEWSAIAETHSLHNVNMNLSYLESDLWKLKKNPSYEFN